MLAAQQVLAYEFKGRRYDCGSKIGYLEATVALAMKHPAVAEDFVAFLSQLRLDGSMKTAGSRTA